MSIYGNLWCASYFKAQWSPSYVDAIHRKDYHCVSRIWRPRPYFRGFQYILVGMVMRGCAVECYQIRLQSSH